MKNKYKTLIISCWVVLLCCFVVKLLGGNFFEIVCKNERFVKFCNFCNVGIPYAIIALITYTFSTSLYLMAVCKYKKPKLWLVVSVIIMDIIKLLFLNYAIVTSILEFLFLLLYPIIINKKLWKRSIIGYLLIFAFQLISLLAKNIGVKIMNNDLITQLIFSIDYYIMLILYWLYSIKEEQNGSIRNLIFRKRR